MKNDQLDKNAEREAKIKLKQAKCRHRSLYDGGKNSTIKYTKCLQCGLTTLYT